MEQRVCVKHDTVSWGWSVMYHVFTGPGGILITVNAYSQRTVNVIDLNNEDRTCDDLNFGALLTVEGSQSMHGTFIGGSLLVCGVDRKDCFTYDVDSQNWFRTVERNYLRFIPYGLDMDGYHWVSGGNTVESMTTYKIQVSYMMEPHPHLTWLQTCQFPQGIIVQSTLGQMKHW